MYKKHDIYHRNIVIIKLTVKNIDSILQYEHKGKITYKYEKYRNRIVK